METESKSKTQTSNEYLNRILFNLEYYLRKATAWTLSFIGIIIVFDSLDRNKTDEATVGVLVLFSAFYLLVNTTKKQ